jgi:hypothetical protein
MKTSEKAKHIINRFDFEVRDLDNELSHTRDEAIQCALIFVDMMLIELQELHHRTALDHWIEVKREINKIKDSFN